MSTADAVLLTDEVADATYLRRDGGNVMSGDLRLGGGVEMVGGASLFTGIPTIVEGTGTVSTGDPIDHGTILLGNDTVLPAQGKIRYNWNTGFLDLTNSWVHAGSGFRFYGGTDGGGPAANILLATIKGTGDIDAVSYGGVLKANLLDKAAAETISGAYTYSANTRHGDSVEVELGDAADASLYWNGSDLYIDSDRYIRQRTTRLYVGDGVGEGGSVYLLFDGPTNDGWIYWTGANDRFTSPDEWYFSDVVGIGTTAGTQNKLKVLWWYGDVPSVDIQGATFDVRGTGTTESARALSSFYGQAILSDATLNAGINFSQYRGAVARSIFTSSANKTWASNDVYFYGGDYQSQYDGTGVLSANSVNFVGSRFLAYANKNPTGAMTIDTFFGGEFELLASTSMANLTMTDAAAGNFPVDVSGVGTVTRLYGIRIPAFLGSGSTEWGINCEEDAQIASDKWLLLEGNLTTKGDTGIRYDSGNTRIQVQVNGTDNLLIGATTLGVFATAPVAQQTVTGAKGGNTALASLLTSLANYGLIVDSTT